MRVRGLRGARLFGGIPAKPIFGGRKPGARNRKRIACALRLSPGSSEVLA